MIIDSNIAPIDYFAGITPTPSPISYRRNFDPIKFVLYFDDKEYKIQEVFDAINDLLLKVAAIRNHQILQSAVRHNVILMFLYRLSGFGMYPEHL